MNVFVAALVAFWMVGCLYLVVAAWMAARLPGRARPPMGAQPPVTILKPLRGLEPGLYENLESFCHQDYAGAVQIVCGFQSMGDPAVAVVRRLIAAYPDRRIDLVIDARIHGSNGKISNLCNMQEKIRHEIVILSDSDIRVAPDWLGRMIAALAVPGVAGVTCLYRGMPGTDGLCARLSALAIDSHFLPSVVFAIEAGLAEPCFGSGIALRRETLDEIGGFRPFKDVLADDYQLGAAIRKTGGRIAVPAFTVGHGCPETTWPDLWHHELRWARTIRGIDPMGHFGSLVTHPMPFALAWLVAAPGWPAIGALCLALTCRIVLCMRIEQALGVERHHYALIPLRDALSFAVFLASYLGRGVRWKGETFSVARDGAMAHDRRPTLS